MTKPKSLFPAIALLVVLSAAGLQAQQCGPGYQGVLNRLGALPYAATVAPESAELNLAKEFLAARNLRLSTTGGLAVSGNCDPTAQSFAFPVQNGGRTLLDPISVKSGRVYLPQPGGYARKFGARDRARTNNPEREIDVSRYNAKYAAGRVTSSIQWVLYIHRPERSTVFFLEIASFQGDQLPVVVLSTLDGGKVVLNFQEDILYTVAPSETVSASAPSLGFWQCVAAFLGVSGFNSLVDVINTFCGLASTAQSLVGIYTTVTSCVPQPAPCAGSCALGIITATVYLTCQTAQCVQAQ